MEYESICAVFNEEQRALIQESIEARIRYYESKIKNYRPLTGKVTLNDTLERYEDRLYKLKEALQTWIIESS